MSDRPRKLVMRPEYALDDLEWERRVKGVQPSIPPELCGAYSCESGMCVFTPHPDTDPHSWEDPRG